MEQVSPAKFLEYARFNFNQLKDGNQERVLINTYGCIAKGFHAQVDQLIEYIKILKKPKSELIEFPNKFEFIKNTKLFAPDQILFLNKYRNDLEHRYLVPPKEVVQLSLGYLEYFIRDSKEFMSIPAKTIRDFIDNKLKELDKKLRHSGSRESTIETYLWQARKFFNFFGKNPDLINSQDADYYLQKMIDEKYPAGQIQHIEAILYYIFENILNKKWEKGAKRPQIHHKKPPFIDKGMMDKIVKYAPSLRDKLIIKVIRSAGLKTGELIKLKVRDINKLNLSSEELMLMKKYIGNRKDGNLFLSNVGKPLGHRGIQNLFISISKKINKRITSEMVRKSNPHVRFEIVGGKRSFSKKPRKILLQDELLTEQEVLKIAKHVLDERKRDYFYFAFHLGIGLNQFKTIKFEDINFNNGFINVAPAKHYNFDKIQISEEITNKLKEYCKKYQIKNGFLFPQRKETMRYLMESAGKESGVSPKKLGYGILANSKKFTEYYK
ncbi:phage integrase N-terminal SAM-like domain-containing protein [Candidatus Woesearchaeota archaeon]|nr:phage integrase N-terminal SAM-like domain-containing protein [Candidatus Woesearchaeota archaeon]